MKRRSFAVQDIAAARVEVDTAPDVLRARTWAWRLATRQRSCTCLDILDVRYEHDGARCECGVCGALIVPKKVGRECASIS